MYTISQVSAMLGIPSVTLRAWEQRYHAVTPVRTDGGYRVYTEENIADLRWLKRQVEELGMSIGQASLLLKRKQTDSRVVVESMEASRPNMDEIYQGTADRLLDALAKFRSEQAKSILDLGFSMYGYENMIGEIIAPLLLGVGDRWESGELSVAQEHFITQFMKQRCQSFFQLFPIDPRLPKALAFCPAGESHDMGLLLFSLFLRQKGVDVLFLGADTPEDGIEALIREAQIRFVAISFTDATLCSQVVNRVDRMKEIFPQLEFGIGGQGAYALPTSYKSMLLANGGIDSWKQWFEETYLSLAVMPVELTASRNHN